MDEDDFDEDKGSEQANGIILVFDKTRRWLTRPSQIYQAPALKITRSRAIYKLRSMDLLTSPTWCYGPSAKVIIRWRVAKHDRLGISGKGLVVSPLICTFQGTIQPSDYSAGLQEDPDSDEVYSEPSDDEDDEDERCGSDEESEFETARAFDGISRPESVYVSEV